VVRVIVVCAAVAAAAVWAETALADSPAPPTVTGVSPASPANHNNPKVQGNAPDGTTVVAVYDNDACTGDPLNTGDAATFASPGIAVHVADDSTTDLYATATDLLDERSDCSSTSATYVEDSTPPPVQIDFGPPANTTKDRPTFDFHSTDPTAALACSVDTGTPQFRPCQRGHFKQDTTLPDGPWTFRVRATDAASNSRTATRQFTVDTTPPTTTIIAHPRAVSRTHHYSETVSFSFVSNDPTARFLCKLDHTPVTSCTSPATYVVPAARGAESSHLFHVSAVDVLGNAGIAPTFSFRVLRAAKHG
jgi:hypothetical protein